MQPKSHKPIHHLRQSWHQASPYHMQLKEFSLSLHHLEKVEHIKCTMRNSSRKCNCMCVGVSCVCMCVCLLWPECSLFNILLRAIRSIPWLLCPSLFSQWERTLLHHCYLLCSASREIKCSWAVNSALTLCRIYLCNSAMRHVLEKPASP